MKITLKQLKSIIKEEIDRNLSVTPDDLKVVTVMNEENLKKWKRNDPNRCPLNVRKAAIKQTDKTKPFFAIPAMKGRCMKQKGHKGACSLIRNGWTV